MARTFFAGVSVITSEPTRVVSVSSAHLAQPSPYKAL